MLNLAEAIRLEINFQLYFEHVISRAEYGRAIVNNPRWYA